MENLPGFYGKFPELGDFVNRRLSQSFIDPWDSWLQGAVAASRSALGGAWLNSYLTSPIWRFALAKGLTGEHPCCGLLMPSVDRVGRYFPLTIACRLPMDANLVSVASLGTAWFEKGEQIILTALQDGFDMDSFDQAVSALGNLDTTSQYFGSRTDKGFGQAWQIPLKNNDGRADFSFLTHQLLLQRLGDYSLWWGAGSASLAPSLLVCAGMPLPQNYAAMLDGNWNSSSWEQWSSEQADEKE